MFIHPLSHCLGVHLCGRLAGPDMCLFPHSFILLVCISVGVYAYEKRPNMLWCATSVPGVAKVRSASLAVQCTPVQVCEAPTAVGFVHASWNVLEAGEEAQQMHPHLPVAIEVPR